MSRPKFITRTIRLIGADQVATAIAAIKNAPIDQKKPLVVTIGEEVKARSLDQNALLWSGPMTDIAEQCWANGMQYSKESWHEHLKRMFLPEEYDPELCKNESYVKWVSSPGGISDLPILAGSTTHLTKKGFAQYVEQVYAFGAQHGAQFSASKLRGNHE